MKTALRTGIMMGVIFIMMLGVYACASDMEPEPTADTGWAEQGNFVETKMLETNGMRCVIAKGGNGAVSISCVYLGG